jgi:hypothetical protein
MVEMLMTAFILAVGLLGLCMLQTMSLRAGRGGQSLTTAVHVANAVMDQVELEGRLSWLNLNQYNTQTVAAALPSPFYMGLAVAGQMAQSFNLEGYPPDASSTLPAQSQPFFQVVTTRVDDVGTANGSGQLSDFSVQVTFTDVAGSVPRTVVLTRRILHG